MAKAATWVGKRAVSLGIKRLTAVFALDILPTGKFQRKREMQLAEAVFPRFAGAAPADNSQ